jgi:catechol-2,3-dioxygenase
MTTVRLGSVSLDCSDPQGLAAFYAALTGQEVAYESESFCALRLDAGPWLSMQKVEDYRAPEWPEGDVPQQMHLDFSVADLDDAERAALAAGARRSEVQPSPDRWRVMFDPAGHPFCLTTLIPE